MIAAARQDGSRIAAAGTHPFSHWGDQALTPKRPVLGSSPTTSSSSTREQIIFGCHVHVGIADREAAIAVMNRSRPWLATILALSSNSPFWLGVDTGYRQLPDARLFGRFPMTGTPHAFASRVEYDELVAAPGLRRGDRGRFESSTGTSGRRRTSRRWNSASRTSARRSTRR